MQRYIEREKKPWDILNNKHDSYLIQCPLEDVKECAKISTEFMGQELTAPDGTKFRMKSEALAGYNWAPAGPKNPRGLGSVSLN